jgi:hypothetical protein
MELSKGNEKRCVIITGDIRVGKNSMLYFSKPLGRKMVGLKEIRNKNYQVNFRQFFLGYADFNDMKMYDIMRYNNELKV